MRDHLALKDMHSAVPALYIQRELRAEILELHIRRVHHKALCRWWHMHAHATSHTTRFPCREDLHFGGTFDQNRGTAEKLDLRHTLV